MKFGLFHSVQWPEGTDLRERYREAISQVLHAEELGYEAVWFTEHHFSRHGIVSDTFCLLSHLAALTKRIRLGTAVAVLPFHNPVRLAESAAMVDLLSEGRLDFGIGRGYQWTEFHGFGVPMEERGPRFNEAIEVVLRSWTSDAPFSYEGKYWRFEDANPLPKPVQRPHPPVWVATDSDEGFRMCARNGWGVMLPQGRTLATVANQVARYKQALASEGVAYDPAKVVLARGLYVAPDDETAWAEAESYYTRFQDLAVRLATPPGGGPVARNPFESDTDRAAALRESVVFGSPKSCAAMLRRIAELGIEYVIFFTNFGGIAHDKIMRTLELFAAEVAPQLIREQEVLG